MKKILILNAGSSSVKWQLFDLNSENVVAKGLVERIMMPQTTIKIDFKKQTYVEKLDNVTYESAIKLIFEKIKQLNISQLDKIKFVGHRVVAGGEKFKKATKISKEVLEEIKDLSYYAPLHNLVEARCIEILQKILPNTVQYAVFDSQFFTDMPKENAIYGLPYEYTEKYGIRRYGEHGISHSYLASKAARLLDTKLETLKLITLHLGSGSSISAVNLGKAFESSMGFTPLTGLIMGTRSGDLDPSILVFLMNKLKLTSKEVLDIFESKSGLLGISGISSDMRDITQSIDNKRCSLARKMFVNKILEYIGSYLVKLQGADAIIFSGGIGENDSKLREEVCEKLTFLGIKIDKKLNQSQKEGIISTNDSQIKVLVIPTDEELSMVKQIKEVAFNGI